MKGNEKLQVPVFVLTDPGQILQAFTSWFAIFAKKGVLVHLMSTDYAPYKKAMRKDARELIKRLTAHNGKLGFNWSVRDSAYEEVTSKTR